MAVRVRAPRVHLKQIAKIFLIGSFALQRLSTRSVQRNRVEQPDSVPVFKPAKFRMVLAVIRRLEFYIADAIERYCLE